MSEEHALIPGTDRLSQAARDILKVNVRSAYTALVVAGRVQTQAAALLQSMSPETVLSRPPTHRDEASGVLAGLWLWHDGLDESHKLSQSLQTVSGSFWHAIMHRREGDFSNSRYWYARCANHPVIATLSAQAGDVTNPFPADKRVLVITIRGWDTNALVDLVERVHRSPADPAHQAAVALQQFEWRVLFDHCVRSA